MNETDGKTLTCGLLAHPAGHTVSPLIHNMLAEETGENLIYIPFDVAPENLGDAVKGAAALNLLGLNATVPHKEAVIPFLKEIDPLAGKIGAVNTLVRTADGSGYRGYNTDMTGLLRSLTLRGVRIKGENVIILGAGGVARAVAFLAADKGASNIYILNRTLPRADEVAREVSSKFSCVRVNALSLDAWKEIPHTDADGNAIRYLCIQCTSVGMYPHNDQVVIDDPDFYQLIHTGFDIVYRPIETRFMKLASDAGAKVYNGLEMLLYQGVEAYELWTGRAVSQDICDKVYKAMEEFLAPHNNIVLVGYMGSGKSTVSKVLARILDCEALDTDALIEETYECSISDIFREKGEGDFRNIETSMLRTLANEKHDNRIIATGGGAVLRPENRRLLNQIGTVVYLKASPESVYDRICGDTTRPLLQVDDPKAKIAEMLKQRDIFYEMSAGETIVTDGLDPEQIADEIIRRLHLN